MNIEANKKMLVIRFNTFQNFDFIKEHTDLINMNGYVWIYKVGKMIPGNSLDSILSESRKIILRAPKKDGGKYYLASLKEYSNGAPPMDVNYPKYYSEMIDSEFMSSLNGTWLKISEIRLLGSEEVDVLYLCKNDKSLDEILNTTRTSTLYVYSKKSFNISEVK